MLGEGLNDDINGSIGTAEKRFSINLSKTNEKCYLSLVCFLFIDRKEVSFKGNVYYFSVDYNAINKFDISNISKFLMVKSTIKQCYRLLNKCLLHY